MMMTAARSQKPATGKDDDEIDLMAFARVLWRGKWVIGLCALIAVLGASYYVSRIAEPRYQSTAELTLNLRDNEVVNIQDVVSGVSTEYNALNTELEIIRSRNLLGQVVDRLDLTNDPEFNPALRTPSASERRIAEFKTSIGNAISALRQSILPTETEEVFDTSPQASRTVRDGIIGRLKGMISASIKQYTYVFTISVTTGSPEQSERIANTLANVYIEEQIAVKFEATEQAVTWLSDRVSTLEQDLKEREDALKEAMSETDMVNPEALEGLTLQAKDLRDRLRDTRTQIAQTENRISRLNALRKSGDLAEIVALTEDPVLNRLLMATPGGQPDAIEEFDARLDTILDRAQAQLERLRRQVASLQTSSEQLVGRIERQSADLVRIQQMEREVEATRTLYETFLTRLKEITVQRGLQQADSRVLSDAMPGGQVAPRAARIQALSLILGSMVGAGLILLRNFMYNSFRTSEELEAATGLFVMGQIPIMPIKKRGELLKYLSDKPTSAAAEAIRNVRTSILLSNIDTPPKVIMTTSALPEEGKTTAAIALAHNFSAMGKKVLLIEGDIRRRRFQEFFKIRPKTGLITTLSDETPFDQSVFYDERLGADVLMAEKSRVNAADFFSSDRFRDFLTEMRELYNFIIIDTPPVLVVPDARVIGQYVDATIFLVAWDSTQRGQVTAALRDLASVNLEVAGLVLSQVDPKGMQRYGYGKGYYYGKAYYETG